MTSSLSKCEKVRRNSHTRMFEEVPKRCPLLRKRGFRLDEVFRQSKTNSVACRTDQLHVVEDWILATHFLKNSLTVEPVWFTCEDGTEIEAEALDTPPGSPSSANLSKQRGSRLGCLNHKSCGASLDFPDSPKDESWAYWSAWLSPGPRACPLPASPAARVLFPAPPICLADPPLEPHRSP
jgi:hypothetical protein